MKILELIQEEDPPRPSHRLSSSSGEVNSAVSEVRRLHPTRLHQLLRGELDWVVMKALEKDRVRRYQTANDLSQDLTNYLTGETVTARDWRPAATTSWSSCGTRDRAKESRPSPVIRSEP